MPVVFACMAPHPPLIIPEIGKGEERRIEATIQAYEETASRLAAVKPETVVILSPHTVMYEDYFHISPGTEASGDFRQFGARVPAFHVPYDEELAQALCETAKEAGVPAGMLGERDKSLDHGTMVPLAFLSRLPDEYRFVRIGLSGLPLTDHYRLGQCVKEASARSKRRIAVIASGDLSHRLKEDGPYGFRKEGPVYDRRVMELMGRGDFGELFEFSDDFLDRAGECGHRAFVILAGALDQTQVKAERLSYEGPFGVGYGICTFYPGGRAPERGFVRQYEEKGKEKARKLREGQDAYVQLARRAVETYVGEKRLLSVPEGLGPDLISRRAGAFVSLKLDGRLRGCIGTISPVTGSLAEEIIRNGVSAAVRDPRFSPVKVEELDRLVYSVDVLGEPEKVSSKEELDVKRYGVIVSSDGKKGLLLPDLDGVETVEEQIAIARQKAGIGDEEVVVLERFEVKRHR